MTSFTRSRETYLGDLTIANYVERRACGMLH